MKRHASRLATFAALCILVGAARASAATPVTTEPLPATATVGAALTPTPAPGLPPTPGPDTPTPALPEEGGPAGAVLGGITYVDRDGSRSLTAGDTVPFGNNYVGVDLINAPVVNGAPVFFSKQVPADRKTGRWQLRAVPPGTYRVSWLPPVVDPADIVSTFPPRSSFQLPPGNTVSIPNVVVTVRDAERILDINFGESPPRPVVGTSLPGTGRGGANHSSVGLAITAAALAVAGAGALLLARRRRI